MITEHSLTARNRRITKENLNYETSGYSEYKGGRGIGCVIHWIAVFGCNQYDQITIGNGEIHLWGELIARYTWKDGNIPYFDWQRTNQLNLNKIIDYLAFNQDVWWDESIPTMEQIYERVKELNPKFNLRELQVEAYNWLNSEEEIFV